MNKIIENANNSNETKVSSSIQINKVDKEWKQDEMDKNYVSKIYEVTANANIKNYKITISKENAQKVEDIKITDKQNKEKNEFKANEKFKVLIPIKNMTEIGNFKLKVEGKVQTKPILYGIAPESKYQDYALTAETYEDGSGEKSDEYPKNETKIIIIKQDQETKEKIEGVEFELLDENKNVVYSDLKTNQDGKIEINHLVPGKYYIKETKTKEEYEIYNELIEIEITLQEQYTVTVNNNQKEKNKIEIEKNENRKEISSSIRKKLPVTGT